MTYLEKSFDRVNVLGVGISAINPSIASSYLIEAVKDKKNSYVCVTGVHGIIESHRSKELKEIHNRSLLTVPDGMPAVWVGLEQGFYSMRKVYGPDLMLDIFSKTSEKNNNFTHFLYGATDNILSSMKKKLEVQFPHSNIVGTYSPPFRDLNENEENEISKILNLQKPDFMWVGLSTPKQEIFMSKYSHKFNVGIMIGVGAAFPIRAGKIKDAPNWIKNSGFQWLFRLIQDPKRLWKRYLDIIPRFIFLILLQLFGIKEFSFDKSKREKV